MKTVILHDANGSIVSIAQLLADDGTDVGLIPQAGEFVLELELPQALAQEPLLDIHANYQVDVNKKELIRRSCAPTMTNVPV